MNNNKLNNSIDELKKQFENLILLKDQIKGFNENEFDNVSDMSSSESNELSYMDEKINMGFKGSKSKHSDINVV